MMIQCQQIQKGFGAQSILLDVTCEINEFERVGLIGRNGSGKTTLLHLLNGSEKPDAGQLSIRKGTRIGYLEQVPQCGEHDTVSDVLNQAFHEPMQWMASMRELEQQMADPSQGSGMLEQKLQQYGELQERFERAGGYEIEARIGKVTGGLRIPESQFMRPFRSLSGGEKTKIGLAAMLLASPELLLLDEPTNHLDMMAIDWLEQFLQSYAGTVIIISHDRYFLDRVVTKIIELEDGEAFTYHTNYSGFQQEKEARLLQQFADYQEQKKKIKQMQEAIKQLIEWGNRADASKFHRRAASMQKALDRMTKLKRPILERKSIELNLQQRDRSGVQVLTLDGVGKGYEDRVLFRNASELLCYGEQVALIGNNGSGKSTLLKCILGMESPDEGEIRLGSRVDIGYLAQESAPEEENATVLSYYRTEVGIEEGEARGRLASFLFCGSDVFKKVRNLSGGEWSRLRFALLMHRQPNLLVLDEPTNHLDIDSREALEEALEDFPGTLLAVSHDRYFMNRLAKKIWSLEQGKLVTVHGNYEDYKAKHELNVHQHYPGSSNSEPSGYNRVENARTPHSQQRTYGINNSSAKAANDSARAREMNKNDDMPSYTETKSVGSNRSRKVDATQLEANIHSLEQSLRELDEAMLNPTLASDAGKLAALHNEREMMQAHLEPLYEQWMHALEEQ
ncbi:ABC-F family ATP-binding cassette domain-containing protein [Paenibacillus sp. UMB4589-SE434]|nr:ABC-F family ATP-binding cassette domain-containing protein [Paenibacillus sp. UMB4589-SE434]MDK8181819.1 ABC-F family ATP-binding cassette domain-containing protein [Paenibacillus sp. UMB4589-SE434]